MARDVVLTSKLSSTMELLRSAEMSTCARSRDMRYPIDSPGSGAADAERGGERSCRSNRAAGPCFHQAPAHRIGPRQVLDRKMATEPLRQHSELRLSQRRQQRGYSPQIPAQSLSDKNDIMIKYAPV